VRGLLRVIPLLCLTIMLWSCGLVGVSAAQNFADPRFASVWNADEARTPNFWGPLRLASDGMQEPYNSGTRLVQYFDKGRMEITGGQVTFGLLATQMVTGDIQEGDASFRHVAPSLAKIAGDADGLGPSYRTIYDNRAQLLAPRDAKPGQEISFLFDKGNNLIISPNPASPGGPLANSMYDDATQHNVLAAFADYRARVGAGAIGLAISEPFAAYFTVGGVERAIAVQVFERRVLTYTEGNPPEFRVEMGNIGQHFLAWVSTGG
jgi:polysaccharide biosynthesis protein PslG